MDYWVLLRAAGEGASLHLTVIHPKLLRSSQTICVRLPPRRLIGGLEDRFAFGGCGGRRGSSSIQERWRVEMPPEGNRGPWEAGDA